MKVLDLFCGMGGWSIPFIEDGDEVWGIDIEDYGFPGNLIKSDIRELDGYGFHDMDLIIGSTPCTGVSQTKLNFKWHPKGPDIDGTLKLVSSFNRFVKEAQPRFWGMENVRLLERWYQGPVCWHFKISRGAYRTMWGNLPLGMIWDLNWKRSLYKDYGGKQHAERAKIPYPIARYVADSVKRSISQKEKPQRQ